MDDWPYLAPPPVTGAFTAADVARETNSALYAALLDRWAEHVWESWADHHHTVRRWAAVAADGAA